MKAMKKLIATTTVRGELDDENFQHGLLEYRNTPREGGLSPAQILFGHPLRSAVPALRAAFSDKWQKTANEYDARRSRVHAQHEERYNTQSRSLQPLHIGAEVRVQHPTTKKWDHVGVIIGIGQNRDYHVKLPSGRVYWRNRRFLRSSYGAPPNGDATNDEPDDIDHDGAPTPASRRTAQKQSPTNETKNFKSLNTACLTDSKYACFRDQKQKRGGIGVILKPSDYNGL